MRARQREWKEKDKGGTKGKKCKRQKIETKEGIIKMRKC